MAQSRQVLTRGDHQHKYKRANASGEYEPVASGGPVQTREVGGMVQHRHRGLLWAVDSPGHTHPVVGGFVNDSNGDEIPRDSEPSESL